ncbi:GAF domain-containing protein [Rhizobium leguminosarum]|uniref:GAF domain-containing protein n=1 Tax=Rhizobium leguminosarum TaxID=384 RepID=UPI001031859C|nr:GAF domain-containing protein [Rhizobium leguminosarum]TAZ12401.1 GAF domain-containing protein [Rhizobium leguminosarum]
MLPSTGPATTGAARRRAGYDRKCRQYLGPDVPDDAGPQLGRLLFPQRRRTRTRAISGQAGLRPHPNRPRRLRDRGQGRGLHPRLGRPRFPRPACDAASRSELVVPIRTGDDIIGVIDLDSPLPSRFDANDQAGIERLAEIFTVATTL